MYTIFKFVLFSIIITIFNCNFDRIDEKAMFLLQLVFIQAVGANQTQALFICLSQSVVQSAGIMLILCLAQLSVSLSLALCISFACPTSG